MRPRSESRLRRQVCTYAFLKVNQWGVGLMTRRRWALRLPNSCSKILERKREFSFTSDFCDSYPIEVASYLWRVYLRWRVLWKSSRFGAQRWAPRLIVFRSGRNGSRLFGVMVNGSFAIRDLCPLDHKALCGGLFCLSVVQAAKPRQQQAQHVTV